MPLESGGQEQTEAWCEGEDVTQRMDGREWRHQRQVKTQIEGRSVNAREERETWEASDAREAMKMMS